MSVVRVCFVCLGNICRSPTAEAIFVRDVSNAGLSSRFRIDSAGTGDWHVGQHAHPETRRTAQARGVPITHLARQFVAHDFDAFDVILVMDRSNHRNVLALAPDEAARAKVHCFRDFEADTEPMTEVPDPYHVGGFDEVFDICERASRGLLAHLVRTHELTAWSG